MFEKGQRVIVNIERPEEYRAIKKGMVGYVWRMGKTNKNSVDTDLKHVVIDWEREETFSDSNGWGEGKDHPKTTLYYVDVDMVSIL